MRKYRVAITVILDPIEADNSEAAKMLALKWVQMAINTDTAADLMPRGLSEGIGNGDGQLECLIRGAVISEIKDDQ
jgi:hypothetical protein